MEAAFGAPEGAPGAGGGEPARVLVPPPQPVVERLLERKVGRAVERLVGVAVGVGGRHLTEQHRVGSHRPHRGAQQPQKAQRRLGDRVEPQPVGPELHPMDALLDEVGGDCIAVEV